MAENTEGDLRDLLRSAQDRGGGTLLTWGVVSAAAFTAAFASWQYGPKPQQVALQTDGGLTTGAVAGAVRAGGPVRAVPLGGAPDLSQVQRDLADVRADLADIRRTLARLDTLGEQQSRRLDTLDDQAAVLTRRMALAAEQDKVRASAAPPPVPPAAPQPAAPVAIAPLAPAQTTIVPQQQRAEPPVLEPPRPVRVISRPVPAETAAPETKADPSTPPKGQDKAPEAAADADRPASKPEPKAATAVPAKPAIALTLKPPQEATPAPAAVAKPAAAPVVPPRVPPPPVDQTGSIPIKPPAAPEAAARTEFAVDLGGFKSMDQLRKAWTATSGRYTALTKPLQPLGQIRETPNGMEARLVAGPFANALDAAKFCAQVKATGTACAPSVYVGQPVAPN